MKRQLFLLNRVSVVALVALAWAIGAAAQSVDDVPNPLEVPVITLDSDGMFTIDALRCIGACGIAPAVTINGKVYPKMSVDKVAGVVQEYRDKGGAQA